MSSVNGLSKSARTDWVDLEAGIGLAPIVTAGSQAQFIQRAEMNVRFCVFSWLTKPFPLSLRAAALLLLAYSLLRQLHLMFYFSNPLRAPHISLNAGFSSANIIYAESTSGSARVPRICIHAQMVCCVYSP